MSDYEILVTEAQGRKLALEIAESATSHLFLRKMIETALFSLAKLPDGIAKLNDSLNKEGYTVGTCVADAKPAKACKPKRTPAVAADDEEPKEWRNTKKHYDPVEENGPKVLALICRYSLSVETLRDKFEVTPEEYERIRSQHWADFGKRFMHELLTALTKMYAKEKQREALQLDDKRPKPVRLMKPAQMTRPQLVAELNSLFNNHSWLTRAELVNNFEMCDDDYEAIKSLNHLKVTVHELRMYLTDVRGAIAERAIEIPSKAVADEPN